MSKKVSPLDKPRPRAWPTQVTGIHKKGESLCDFLVRIRNTEKDIVVRSRGSFVPLADVPLNEWAMLVSKWWEERDHW